MELDLRDPLSYGEPDIPFAGSVHTLVIGRDGTLYAAADADPYVYVFDANGAYVSRIGGPGEGPGEHASVWRIGLLGNSVWTIDSRLRRLTFFDLHGSVVATEPIAPLVERDGRKEFVMLSPLADGRVVGVAGQRGPRGELPVTMELLISTTSAAAVESLTTIDWRGRQYQVDFQARQARIQGRNPFGKSDRVVPCPREERTIVVREDRAEGAATSQLVVEHLDHRAATSSTWRVTAEPRRATREHLEGWLDTVTELEILAEAGAIASVDEGRRAVSEAVDLPDYLPAVPNLGRGLLDNAVFCDHDAKLWIGAWELGDEEGWRVFDSLGRELGIARAPEGRIMTATAQYVWTVLRDPYDVERIVRYAFELDDDRR